MFYDQLNLDFPLHRNVLLLRRSSQQLYFPPCHLLLLISFVIYLLALSVSEDQLVQPASEQLDVIKAAF